MLRRFTVFVSLLLLPWLIMLAHPGLRSQLWLLATGSRQVEVQVPWALAKYSHTVIMPDEPDGVGLNRQVWDAHSDQFIKNPEKRLERLGALWDNHPDQIWIAARALATLPSYRDGRVEYLLADPGMTKASISRVDEFTPGMVVRALAIAEQGRKLEPRNAYFDWMRARILIAAYRDGEALDALKEAASKPVYDEHLKEWLAAVIECASVNRPLLAEEKLRVISSLNLEHLSINRHVVNWLGWKIADLEKQGRFNESLAVAQALTRVGALQIRQSLLTIETVRGRSGIMRAWLAGSRTMRDLPYATREKIWATQVSGHNFAAQRYTTYLKQHGRSDWVPEARQHLQLLNAWSQEWKGRRRDGILSTPQNSALSLTHIYWSASGMMLVSILFSAGLWFLGTIIGPLSWRPPTDATGFSLLSRSVVYPIVLGWGGALLLLAGAGLELTEQLVIGISCGITDFNAPAWGLSGMALLLPFVCVAVAQILSARSQIKTTQMQGSWWPNLTELGLPPFIQRAWHGALWMGRLLIGGVLVITTPLSLAFLIWGIPSNWNFLASVDSLELRHSLNFLDPAVMMASTPILWGFCILAGLIRWRWFAPGEARPIVAASFRAFRSYAAWNIVLCSWLLLLTFIMATPHRQNVERQLEQFLKTENQGAGQGVTPTLNTHKLNYKNISFKFP